MTKYKTITSSHNKLNPEMPQNLQFPNNFRRDSTSQELHNLYDPKTPKELESMAIKVSVAGRMIMKRIMGKASFITLQDMDGRIQLYLVNNNLSSCNYYEQFKKWNLGDIIGASGKIFKTRTGELSVYCKKIQLLTKTLRPLPSKFHGLVDHELRYRQRYLDLIANEKSRFTFKTRSKIINEMRNFMLANNFIEVETPMMHLIPGGATAKPFITHHNSLDIDIYLRIAPELYLKRLVIGGLERVFEINRNFRNEGLSTRHNPEFTMIELYMAYADYKDLMNLIENLLYILAKKIFGTVKIAYGQNIFDFSKPYKKLTLREAIKKYHPKINFIDLDDFNKAVILSNSLGIKVESHWKLGHIITEIFEKTVVEHLIQPTFITEYPIEVSPLARRNDHNSAIADRFEFFINGTEIGNGFSELNDVADQSNRLVEQVKNVKELAFYDQDFITALEYGLPPTAGLGIGIDRLVMIFTNNQNIRDVILFPTLRPNK